MLLGAWRTHPAIFQRLLPTLAVLAHADDDVHAIVARVEALSVALGAIAYEGERVIFEIVLQLGERPVAALVDDFLRARKIERFNTADGLRETQSEDERRRISEKETSNLECGCPARQSAGEAGARRGEQGVAGRICGFWGHFAGCAGGTTRSRAKGL
jgi:hypothetical protein